eukprot:TRINITY_DN46741_c0_g1_i1.p1 TRINITY_DN46741_c0_g1~~TRINITY_DN46741_c0_g1_i1.p1  ORF type:complete len:240 (+),score=79.83 TRINITY_DN46741_c0_g1_i1:72-791(+)
MRSVLRFVSPGLYFVGCAFLLPGTVLLLPKYADRYADAIHWLVAATSLLTAAAVWDLVPAVWAACCKRSEQHAELEAPPVKEAVDTEQLLEPEPESESEPRPCCTPPALLGPVMMFIGGALFLTASVFWLPDFDTKVLWGHTLAVYGTSVFRTGSCAYLTGSFSSLPGLHAAFAVKKSKRASIGAVLAGVYAYVAGAILYIAGGIVSQAGADGFAQIWITGSACFALGATLFLAVTFVS